MRSDNKEVRVCVIHYAQPTDHPCGSMGLSGAITGGLDSCLRRSGCGSRVLRARGAASRPIQVRL